MFDFTRIPLELRDRAQWLVWRFEPGEKKPQKIPYYLNGKKRYGGQGDDADRRQLATLDKAIATVEKSKNRTKSFDGVGFAFLPGDGLIGIDIDKCLNPETGEISPIASEIMDACQSYTEYSPSRTGVHIIVSGHTETFKSNKVGLEVFCSSQYFTFTAQLFGGLPEVIAPISETTLERLRFLVKGDRANKPDRPIPPLPPERVDERARLEAALSFVSPDGYDVWFRVGMGLYSALGDAGFRLWDYWSSKSDNYAGSEECKKKWASFGKRGTQITSATIFKLAIDGGWKPPRSLMPPPTKPRPAPAPPRPLVDVAPISADQGKEEELSSVAQAPQGEEVNYAGVETPENEVAGGENAPSLDDIASLPIPDIYEHESLSESEVENAPEEIKGLVPLQWVLSHCALIQGSTDVWDSVNQLRIKKPAFVAMVGKDAAKEWEAHADRRSISPRNLPQIVRGVAKQNGGVGDDGMSIMLDRYTLLYGTKSVWDAYIKDIVNFDAMALARGELATRWLAHPSRREIDHDRLVFDPTQKADPETHINMFEGFPIKPKQDDAKAALVLRVLESLCSSEPNSEEIFTWVLKWLAYPLQHPGAKMQTALLFFGQKQGTGKSLFFEGIVKPLYGKHGATGGQNQLDAAYSHWRAKKLYILFEEILSRQDKYSSFGLVKHLITGRDTSITQKFKDERLEINHSNVVMLSNEFQAVPLEPDDRRFLVVECRQFLDPDLLAELTALLEANDGVIEAFYDFLLRYPLGDFNAHTKPLMTPSKQRMIDYGRPDWEIFYLEWASKALDVPYCSCLSEHLFLVYEAFCSKYKYRALSLTKFSELLSTKLKKDRQWVQLGTKDKKLRSVFHVPSEVEQPITQWCREFMAAADIKE